MCLSRIVEILDRSLGFEPSCLLQKIVMSNMYPDKFVTTKRGVTSFFYTEHAHRFKQAVLSQKHRIKHEKSLLVVLCR